MMDRSMIERIVEEQKKILEGRKDQIEAYRQRLQHLRKSWPFFRAEGLAAAETSGCRD